MSPVLVYGPFDDLRSRDIRFLQEASNLGPLHVLLWSDAAVAAATGKAPKFPQAEREYFLQGLRYVDRVTALADAAAMTDALPAAGGPPATWAVDEPSDHPAKRAWAARNGLAYRVIADSQLAGYPAAAPPAPGGGRKRVIVTGCFDWFHSGHVRFCEECSELGDLYVVVGHDENIRLLKGEGHPLFPAEERRYVVGSVRYVHQALVSTGHGWLDAEPEIERLRPHIYAVNEDGDKPEKRAFCENKGIEYRVLRRLPKPGLPRRQSTALRGF